MSSTPTGVAAAALGNGQVPSVLDGSTSSSNFLAGKFLKFNCNFDLLTMLIIVCKLNNRDDS